MVSGPRKIRIQFDPAQDRLPNGGRLSKGMSSVAAVADALWLVHDETVAIEGFRAQRTTAASIQYARHRRFDLRKLKALVIRELSQALLDELPTFRMLPR